VSSFASFTMGDMRRPSFVKGATDRALQAFGVTHKSIFLGGTVYIFTLTYFRATDWALKKMGDDSFFKKRFIWIDLSDNTFHWCKVQDRSSPHKLMKLSKVTECRIGPPTYSSFLDGRHQAELCWSLECDSGRVIDIKVRRIPLASLLTSLLSQMTDAAKVVEWVRVVEKILSHQSGEGNDIGPINIVT
jgi:hypothetical protein